MSYEHDIFISYRHDCPTTPWMKNVFLHQLEANLKPERPLGIDIFTDDQIRIGSTWSKLLCKKVAASRLLLPMLTPFYFGSEWCRKELALMMEREEKLEIRSTEQSERGLVLPICLWDGIKFPERLKNNVQLGQFQDYTNVRRGTKKWSQFQGKMKELALAIDNILDSSIIPEYDISWLNLTGETIEPQLRILPVRQSTLLRLADSATLPIATSPLNTRTDTT